MPPQAVLTAGGASTQFVRQHLPTNLGPKFHVGSHSSASLRRWRRSGLTPHLPISQSCTPVRRQFQPPRHVPSAAVLNRRQHEGWKWLEENQDKLVLTIDQVQNETPTDPDNVVEEIVGDD